MGLFDKLKKKNDLEIQVQENMIYAPITGNYIPLEQIPDEVFSGGILGNGCGIEPRKGIVYAPVDGVISTVADTLHAIGISGKNGEEFLIHVGMDTVEMNGRGFKVYVKKGDTVKAGQRMMEFDMEEIMKAGYPTTTAFVLTNSDEFENFNVQTGMTAEAGTIIGSNL